MGGFIIYSFESIKARIKSYLENPSSQIEGTFSMDNIGAVSQELARIVTTELLPIPDNVLLDTASDIYLDRRAIDFGEERIQAQKSTGILEFEGTSGTIIPAGTIAGYYTLRFETIEEVIIKDGYAFAHSECTTAGIIGNIDENLIDDLVVSITGINSVSNAESFLGGVDEEDDDSFRSRIIEKIQRPITSGNIYHYEYWARQIAGVGDVKVISCWAGAGTVKVIILSSEGDVPDDVVIENVTEYIQENRPIGADVTVIGAIPIFITLQAELLISTNYNISTVRENTKRAVQDYLSEIAFSDDSNLSYFKVGSIIFDVDGVDDVLSYSINGSTSSLDANFEEFFKLDDDGVVLNGN